MGRARHRRRRQEDPPEAAKKRMPARGARGKLGEAGSSRTLPRNVQVGTGAI